MTEKYYTPTIEEFHYGFEYETCFESYTKWQTIFFGEGISPKRFDFEVLLDMTMSEEIRVKYLDKEDFESILKVPQLKGDDVELNFQLTITDDLFYEFDYDTETHELKVEKWKPTKNAEAGRFDCYTLFKGKVRNKSEFKKILQQLSITKDLTTLNKT